VTDAQQRKAKGMLKAGEDVRVVDGRVMVSGQVSVMEINGLLAKLIVEKNPSRRCFIEQSYPIDWMYPHLSPHGLVFELHPKPIARFEPDSIRKDADYWKRCTAEMIGDWLSAKTSARELCDFADKTWQKQDLKQFKGDSRFAKNDDARKCFSKLRCSIGDLYLWRAGHTRDSDEKAECQSAAEMAFKEAYAICPILPETVTSLVKLLGELRRPDEAFLVARTSARLDPESSIFQSLVRSLKRED
jgi:hypothetical protein